MGRSPKIQVLPPELVNHIAAGEVVERPMSVVKELVENAIDAGATTIEVTCSADARTLIRVADNGCGMDEQDLKTAFKNHATSKITAVEDLFNIATLGFRGEALASVAAVSKLTCVSRTAEMDNALKALVSADGSVELSQVGGAVGTTFEVVDLFYNLPARLKFLKQPKTELAHIEELLQFLALSHPEIRLAFKIQDSTVFQTTGSNDVLATVRELFSVTVSDFLSFSADDPDAGLHVKGLTTIPSVYRSSKKWIFPYINGRSVRCHILLKAIESAYQSMLTPGKSPITILSLTLPRDEVDVNVHPTKKEVRYSAPNSIFSFVRHAIYSALSELPVTNMVTPTSGYVSFPNTLPSNPTLGAVSGSSSFSSQSRTTYSTGTDRAGAASEYPLEREAIGSLFSTSEPFVSTPLVESQNWTILGQLRRTYILLETPEGLLVVDQHIASERVQFERLMDIAEKTADASQTLLVPLTFPLSPELSVRLEDTRAALEQVGFSFEIDESSQFVVHAAPSLYNPAVLRQVIQDMLSEMEETGRLYLNTDDVIATMACHSAVRAGDLLNTAQMTAVMTDWFACQRPWTCPHGRPVSHLISHPELMAYFDRPSLPAL